VAPRIAQIAGIELSGAAAAIETVGAWFVSRRALLVLDNAEQIDDVGGLIGRLMHLAPGLKLIVTSRRRLGAPHEWLLPLGGLDVPPEGSTAAAAAGSDAVQLFVLRARAAQPALDPSRDAEAIARLVRGLGGLPLAIELAAAWVRLLPVADIEVEVASSFDLLERAEDGDERPEHRSVRATFEQSWRLLGPHERELFAALSVFRAPFSRAAAAVIGGASLALLVSLADKSLLRTEAGGRFSLHPLLARFGAEKLARNPDGQSRVRQRHAEYFCRALSAWETWHRVDQKEAVAQVSRELADAAEACRWALAHGQALLVSTALGVLGHVCDLGGRLDEGLALLGEAERALPEQGRPNLLALAQAALSRAMIQSRAARFDASLEDAKRSMRLYRTAREPRGMRMAITAVTNGLTKIGRYAEARRYCEQGLRACEQDRDAENLPVFLNNLALVESQCGFPERAVPLYERALGLSRAAGDRMGIVAQLNNLSAALIAAGAPKRALPHLDEGLRLLEEAGFVGQQSYFFANLAQACFDLGDLPAARRWAELGLQSVRKGSDRSSEPGCLILLGRIAQAQGNMDEARALLRRGAQAAADMHLRRFMVRAVLAFAAFCLHDGRPGEAARLLACVEASGLANRIDLQRAEPLFENTRSALDPQALAEAEAAGRRISLDAALAWIGQPR
jgi:tetratricopeptide (TPR) repeat protein